MQSQISSTARSAELSAALAQLNQATQRTYAIRQDGNSYTLLMPNGMGEYPPVTGETALRQRMLNIALAAKGRGR